MYTDKDTQMCLHTVRTSFIPLISSPNSKPAPNMVPINANLKPPPPPISQGLPPGAVEQPSNERSSPLRLVGAVAQLCHRPIPHQSARENVRGRRTRLSSSCATLPPPLSTFTTLYTLSSRDTHTSVPMWSHVRIWSGKPYCAEPNAQ